MKALVKYSQEDGAAEIRDVPECQIQSPEEVKIKIQKTAICGTDIKVLHGRDQMFRPPVIMGHEFSGIVVETGKEVSRLTAGDQVVVEPTVKICGQCRYCRGGSYNLCSHRLIAGFSAPGSFTEYAVRNEKFVHKLPGGVDLAAGALGEPLAVSVHAALERSRILPGDVVVITGPGTTGLLITQIAAAAGGRVLMVGTAADADRLNIACQIGAEHTFAIQTQKPLLVNTVQELTSGYGADLVFECSGVETAANLCLELSSKQGQYIQVGIFAGKNVSINLDTLCYREISLVGTFSQKPSAWKKALELLHTGKIHLSPLLGPTLPLSDWKKGFALMEKRQAVKVLFDPIF